MPWLIRVRGDGRRAVFRDHRGALSYRRVSLFDLPAGPCGLPRGSGCWRRHGGRSRVPCDLRRGPDDRPAVARGRLRCGRDQPALPARVLPQFGQSLNSMHSYRGQLQGKYVRCSCCLPLVGRAAAATPSALTCQDARTMTTLKNNTPARGGRDAGALTSSYFLNATTFCVCVPRPSMPRCMTSPFLRNTGAGLPSFLMPTPTPGGVPVVMTSPASSVMNWLT